MTKPCNHTSVGMLVWQNGKLLMIERRKLPFGFAPPAGHVDEGETYREAAIRELREEVGLKVKKLKLLFSGRKDFSCRRPGGDWHDWKVYQVEVQGKLKRNLAETKKVGWFSKIEIEGLARRTRQYLDQKISEEEWEQTPGLEPVWYEHFQELQII